MGRRIQRWNRTKLTVQCCEIVSNIGIDQVFRSINQSCCHGKQCKDAEDDTGAVLGERFELLEAIAWGGTAAVYRARDHVTKARLAKLSHANRSNFIIAQAPCSRPG